MGIFSPANLTLPMRLKPSSGWAKLNLSSAQFLSPTPTLVTFMGPPMLMDPLQPTGGHHCAVIELLT